MSVNNGLHFSFRTFLNPSVLQFSVKHGDGSSTYFQCLIDFKILNNVFTKGFPTTNKPEMLSEIYEGLGTFEDPIKMSRFAIWAQGAEFQEPPNSNPYPESSPYIVEPLGDVPTIEAGDSVSFGIPKNTNLLANFHLSMTPLIGLGGTGNSFLWSDYITHIDPNFGVNIFSNKAVSRLSLSDGQSQELYSVNSAGHKGGLLITRFEVLFQFQSNVNASPVWGIIDPIVKISSQGDGSEV